MRTCDARPQEAPGPLRLLSNQPQQDVGRLHLRQTADAVLSEIRGVHATVKTQLN